MSSDEMRGMIDEAEVKFGKHFKDSRQMFMKILGEAGEVLISDGMS